MDIKEWWKQVLANLVGTWLAAVGAGAMTGTMVAYLSSAPLWAYILFILIGIFIGLLILSFRKRQKEEQIVTSRKPTQHGETVELFQSYSELEKWHPRTEILKPENELHGYFLSGEGLLSWNADENIRRFRRIILPKPNAPYLAILQTICSNNQTINPYLRAPDQIKTTRDIAKRNDVPIKWFDDYIGINILICNPERQDGWIHISIAPPFLEAEHQQTYRLEKRLHATAFSSIVTMYERLWREAGPAISDDEQLEVPKAFPDGLNQADKTTNKKSEEANFDLFQKDGARLRAAFTPILAFLEKARRHGSDHERPDASAFLRDAFLSHAAAVEEFRQFIRPEKREAYQQAWNEFCALTHDDGVDAVFMASHINDRDPWSVIEGKIRVILSFADKGDGIEIRIPASPNRAAESILELIHLEVEPTAEQGEARDARIYLQAGPAEYKMLWSTLEGPKEERTLRHGRPDSFLIVARAPVACGFSGYGKPPNTSLQPHICYIADDWFLVHREPKHWLNMGEHRLKVTIRYGAREERSRTICLRNPGAGAGPVTLS